MEREKQYDDFPNEPQDLLAVTGGVIDEAESIRRYALVLNRDMSEVESVFKCALVWAQALDRGARSEKANENFILFDFCRKLLAGPCKGMDPVFVAIEYQDYAPMVADLLRHFGKLPQSSNRADWNSEEQIRDVFEESCSKVTMPNGNGKGPFREAFQRAKTNTKHLIDESDPTLDLAVKLSIELYMCNGRKDFPMTANALANVFNRPPSSARDLIGKLIRRGYIAKADKRRRNMNLYELGPKAIPLVNKYLADP